MIVVRNWGNMALSTDLAWASAVQHAVEMLGVSHMILSFSLYGTLTYLYCHRLNILLSVDTMDVELSRQTRLPIQHTLGRSMSPFSFLKKTSYTNELKRKISTLCSAHQHELECLADSERNKHLVELNVIKQMEGVRDLLDIVSPEKNRRITVHGFIYDRKGHRANRILLN